MTKDEAIEELKKWQECPDKEIAHKVADDVMCSLLKDLGYEDVVNEYEKIGKWYC